MSGRTRGPWKYKETNGGEYGLCTIYSEIDNRGVARHVAIENARLIATAPELVEALERLIAATEWATGNKPQAAIKQARAAINKAGGS